MCTVTVPLPAADRVQAQVVYVWEFVTIFPRRAVFRALTPTRLALSTANQLVARAAELRVQPVGWRRQDLPCSSTVTTHVKTERV